jgi:hypothetical protein
MCVKFFDTHYIESIMLDCSFIHRIAEKMPINKLRDYILYVLTKNSGNKSLFEKVGAVLEISSGDEDIILSKLRDTDFQGSMKDLLNVTDPKELMPYWIPEKSRNGFNKTRRALRSSARTRRMRHKGGNPFIRLMIALLKILGILVASGIISIPATFFLVAENPSSHEYDVQMAFLISFITFVISGIYHFM